MSFWRRCCGLTLEQVRNDRIREVMEAEVTLTNTMEAEQLKRYGHMEGMEEDRLSKGYMNGLQLKGEREETEKYLEEEGKTNNGWKKSMGRRLPR
jgi:hypothetical protein